MKKISSVILSMLMVFALIPMATISASAEGNTLTVGTTGADYTTIADAVAAASDGDTIQLVEDALIENTQTASYGYTATITDKTLTIDTNGFTWYGGTSSGTYKKATNIMVNGTSNVTIINSQRTSDVAITDSNDLSGFGSNGNGLINIDGTATVSLKNLVVNNTNSTGNNMSAAVSMSNATTVNIDNCYLFGYESILVQRSATPTINAKNSLLKANYASVKIRMNLSTDNSNMTFENCDMICQKFATDTYVESIDAISSEGNSQYHEDSSYSYSTLFVTIKNCSGAVIYGNDMNVTFIGTNSFTNVYAAVNVSAETGTSLYSDDTYSTPVTAGVLAENTAIYTTGAVQTTQYDVTIDAGEATKVDEGAEFTFPTSTADGFVAYTDGTNYYDAGQTVAVNENMSFTTLAIGALTMSTGAAMRLNNENGIRFYTNVDTAKVADVKTAGATIEMGTLIAPASYLTDAELTKALDNSKYLDVVFQFEDGEYFTDTAKDFTGVVGSIVKIKEGNEVKDFVGRGYVTVTFGDYTKTIYADYAGADITNNTRSIAQIATSLKADTAAYNLLETAQKTIVDEYAAYIG